MKEKKGFVLNVGTASILLILLVFVLAIFSVLSIQASNNEWNLAEKTGDAVQEYYEADKEAEYMLCCVDAMLHSTSIDRLEDELKKIEEKKGKKLKNLSNVQLELVKDASFSENEQEIGTLTYMIEEQEKSNLEVELAILGNRNYKIKKWKIVREAWEQDEFEEGAELWDGMTE